MGWSTRELAELAGTSLRSVRHYHEVGLLAEPRRHGNGYKQYGVGHLVRLLRIKRLTHLGFSLAQIGELGDGDEHPTTALRALDDDLAATVERLTRLRAELAEILERSVPTDLPADLAARAGALPEADRQLLAVMGRALGEQGREAYATLLGQDGHTTLTAMFEDLDTDAGDAAREALAARLTDHLLALEVEDPRVALLGQDAPGGVPHYVRIVGRALEDLYNPAQLDVVRRVQRRRAAAARRRGATAPPWGT